MLVALAVFAIAALALLRLEGVALASTARLEARLLGGIVARNVANEALSAPDPPPFGLLAGAETNGGRVWRWTRTATRLPDRLERIDVIVTDEAGEGAGTLTVFRALAI